RPREKIWEYYIASNVVGDRSATCHYCSKYWSCGHPGEIEAHLANICHDVPIDMKTYWQESLSTKIHLNLLYDLPSRITLSNRLLEQEVARINLKIDAELKKWLSLSNDQEIASPEVIKQTDTLMISEVINITNLSIETDGQLKVNRSHGSNIKNSNSFNSSTNDLITRMFKANKFIAIIVEY
ncbi:24635_t:CDS:2, partial [Cetraspora pellucida]